MGHWLPGLLLGAVLLSGTVASAGDGRIELNQTSIAAGIPAIGDSPGLPITLGVSSSYVLTSDLVVTDPPADDVIVIDAPYVALDLNGFAIRCEPSPCTPASGLNGIEALVQPSDNHIVIRNGMIRGMPNTGIASSDTRVRFVLDSVRLIDNGGLGAGIGGGSRVSHCSTRGNGAAGIFANAGSLVEGSSALNNSALLGGPALAAASYSVFRSNVASSNASDGLQPGEGSVAAFNTALSNGGDGIADNYSGGTAFLSGVAVGNTASSNTGFGLELNHTGFGRNNLTENNGGSGNPQTNAGIDMGDNVCGTNTTCP